MASRASEPSMSVPTDIPLPNFSSETMTVVPLARPGGIPLIPGLMTLAPFMIGLMAPISTLTRGKDLKSSRSPRNGKTPRSFLTIMRSSRYSLPLSSSSTRRGLTLSPHFAMIRFENSLTSRLSRNLMSTGWGWLFRNKYLFMAARGVREGTSDVG